MKIEKPVKLNKIRSQSQIQRNYNKIDVREMRKGNISLYHPYVPYEGKLVRNSLLLERIIEKRRSRRR